MIDKRKNLSNIKNIFFIISFLQIAITLMPIIIVLAANNTGEWQGEWHGMTFAISIFNFLLYTRAYVLFIVFLLFTLFNPIYSRSSIVVLVSVLISYTFSTAMYGPRLKIALSVTRLIGAQLWIFISVLLIGILLICIGQSYLSNIEKQRELVNE